MPDYGRVRSRVRQTGEGPRVYWYIDFSPALRADGRFLRGFRGESFADREDAERTRLRVCQDAARMPLAEAVELYRRPKVQRFLVSRLASEWLKAVEREPSAKTGRPISAYTLEGYRAVVAHHLAFWEGAQIRDVSAPRLREWVGWMAERGCSPKTTKNALVALRGVVRRFREEHPDMPDPVWPTISVPRQHREAMPLSDILAALDALPEDRAGIFLAMIYTSCRPGEARALEIRDYDFATGRLEIGHAMKGKSASSERGLPKNDETGRYTLPDDLRAWLLKWRGDARLDRTAPLFPNPDTGAVWAHGRLLKWWRRACADGGVTYRPPYFSTKHSPGTALLENGLSREDLQAAFRHRDTRTQLAYDVADDARRERATEALGRMVKAEREDS